MIHNHEHYNLFIFCPSLFNITPPRTRLNWVLYFCPSDTKRNRSMERLPETGYIAMRICDPNARHPAP